MVPSNTKVKRFVMYADGVTAFKDVAEGTPSPNAYSHLRNLNQEDTCHIAQAADLCIMLTRGLDASKGIHKRLGTVSHASWSEVGSNSSPCYNILLTYNSLRIGLSGSLRLTRKPQAQQQFPQRYWFYAPDHIQLLVAFQSIPRTFKNLALIRP